MKAGWSTVKLGEVAKIVNGGTPKSKVAEFWGGNVQWLTPKDMGQMAGREVGTTPRTITEAGLAGSSARLVPERSVILSTRAPIGHLAVNTLPMAFNQGCRGLVPGESVDHLYLYYFLDANRDLLNDLGTGTTFKELSASNLKAVDVPLPPLEEQRRIVTVLDEAFEGLARARANAEANLQNARELLSNALEIELEAASGGTEVKLGDHIELIVGFAFKSKGYTDDPHAMRLLRGDNIIPGGVRWDGVKRWPESDVEAYERYKLAVNDVLIAMDRTWIKSGIKYAVLSEADVPSLLVQRVACLRPKSSLTVDFLAALIGSKAFERYVMSIQTGTGVPHISGGQIKDFSFSLPDHITQERITSLLRNMGERVEAVVSGYEKDLSDLDDLRQSLLQQAFAGALT